MNYYQEPVNGIFKTDTDSGAEEISISQEEWEILKAKWLLSA